MKNFNDLFYPEDFSYVNELSDDTIKNLSMEMDKFKDNIINSNKLMWDLMISDTPKLNEILKIINDSKITEEVLNKFINPDKYDTLRQILMETNEYDDIMLERIINIFKLHDYIIIMYSFHDESSNYLLKQESGENGNGYNNAEDNRQTDDTGEA